MAWRVSIERSAVILIGFPLCVICCFSLAAFSICSLCLILLIWLICVLGCFALGLSYWNSLGFLDLGDYFLPHFREVFNYYVLKYFLMAFLFVFFFWDSYDSHVGAFNIVLVVSEAFLISFNSFFHFSSLLHLFPPFYLLPHLSSASIILLLVPSRVFLISFIALFIIYWLSYFL